MKRKLLIVLFACTVLAVKSNSQADTGYIKIEYLGYSDKPYTEVYFYLPGSLDTSYENFYIWKFEVANNEFDSLVEIINQINVSSKLPILPAELQFTIVKNKKTTFAFTRYIGSIHMVFEEIIRRFKGSANEKEIKEHLETILRRFGDREPLSASHF